MGVAAYQRANDVIRNRIAENDRPVEFGMMEFAGWRRLTQS